MTMKIFKMVKTIIIITRIKKYITYYVVMHVIQDEYLFSIRPKNVDMIYIECYSGKCIKSSKKIG